MLPRMMAIGKISRFPFAKIMVFSSFDSPEVSERGVVYMTEILHFTFLHQVEHTIKEIERTLLFFSQWAIKTKAKTNLYKSYASNTNSLYLRHV